jgi:DNA-binding MarR family transcriptional regulator
VSSSELTLDQEYRTNQHDHDALRLWLRLLTCTNLIDGQVRKQLREQFECTLPRFDLLAQLERQVQGLRMNEVSRRLMVTGGNVTALADQLEAEGWIVRDSDANDRRSTRLKLTERGRREFKRMAVEHEQWIVSLTAGLSRPEQKQLFGLLGKLKLGITAA